MLPTVTIQPLTLPVDVVAHLIAHDNHHLRISDTPAAGLWYIVEDDSEETIAAAETIDELAAELKGWQPE